MVGLEPTTFCMASAAADRPLRAGVPLYSGIPAPRVRRPTPGVRAGSGSIRAVIGHGCPLRPTRRKIAALVSALEATRWTGRPGYPIYSMIGMALAKSIYAVPTWTRTVRAGQRASCPARRHRWFYPRSVRVRLLSLYREAPRLRRHARPLHRRRDGWPERAASRVRPQHRYRRVGHARLRQRAAVRLEGWP
jgi:hypothetical protein